MKKKLFFSLLIYFSISFSTFAQLPDTDIFLVGIQHEKGKLVFGTPENITNRKGYDNQPCFSKDGKSVYYVSVIDSAQSDVYSVNTVTKKISQITFTKESEYSPNYSPNGLGLSVVRVDEDSGQRLYTLPLASIESANQVLGTDSIGYYNWLNDSLVAMFILGPSNTLQVLNTLTGVRTLIASDIGRCMKLSPDKKSLSFVIKSNAKEWYIYSMDCKTLKLERIVETIPENEDFAYLPDFTLLLGSEGKLYGWKKGLYETWTELADFTATVHSFYRITVNADGTRLALVAFTGQKP